jgi:hypothetical protein
VFRSILTQRNSPPGICLHSIFLHAIVFWRGGLMPHGFVGMGLLIRSVTHLVMSLILLPFLVY